MKRGKDVAGLTAALLIASACGRLGIWQVARLHQRQSLNASIEARERLPALQVSGTEPLDSVEWRRVRATGAYDYARERVWTGRSFQGVPGVALLTPLETAGGEVWVNRGWVPSPDAAQVDTVRWREADTATVIGVAVSHTGLPFLVEDSVPPAARGSDPVVTRWPPPELSEGPHLSYAIQWFSFAAIILGGSLILFVKRGSGASGKGTHGETSI